jgi:hypothetical protein
MVKVWELLYLYIAALASWPTGSFALPKTAFGCPEQDVFPWVESPITFWGQHSVSLSNNFHMAGPVRNDSWSLVFCAKYEDTMSPEDIANQKQWPAGDYCLFKVEEHCPEGMLIANITERHQSDNLPQALHHLRENLRVQITSTRRNGDLLHCILDRSWGCSVTKFAVEQTGTKSRLIFQSPLRLLC